MSAYRPFEDPKAGDMPAFLHLFKLMLFSGKLTAIGADGRLPIKCWSH